MPEPLDHELERRVRASLESHAQEADTTAPVATRARAAVRRRRGGRAVLGAVAAVAAVALIAVVVERADPPARTEQPATELPSEWRTEYWHGISVEVPAGWAWGAGPLRQGNEVIRCGGPDDPRVAYVGRPVFRSDVCTAGTPHDPEAPYVWLDAPVAPGTIEVGNGYLQETVELEGATVTVASRDDTLRQRIIDSVRGQQLCRSHLAAMPGPVSESTIEGVGPLVATSACAYQRNGAGGFDLVYAVEPDKAGTEQALAAVATAPESDVLCKDVGEFVVLGGRYADPMGTALLDRRVVLDLTCDQALSAPDNEGRTDYHRLTGAALTAWADQGARSTLSYFIGPLG